MTSAIMDLKECVALLQPPLLFSCEKQEGKVWRVTFTCGENQLSYTGSYCQEPDVYSELATMLLFAGSDKNDEDLREGREKSQEDLHQLFTDEQIAMLYETNYTEY
jgi:hypothetical protein